MATHPRAPARVRTSTPTSSSIRLHFQHKTVPRALCKSLLSENVTAAWLPVFKLFHGLCANLVASQFKLSQRLALPQHLRKPPCPLCANHVGA
eukprot:2758281-Rhodomonas_salina.2